MQKQSQGKSALLRVIPLLLFLAIAQSSTISPTFITTISGTFETGSAVLTASTQLASGSFSSQNTTVTYLNTYASTPLFGYGFNYISSQWTQTSSAIETIIDVSPLSSSSYSQVLQLNFTSSTITLFSINYVVSSSNSFLDVGTYYKDLTGTNIYSSNLNSIRSTTINLPFKTKSNSSNSIAIYSTIGLSMMRASDTFEFQLNTLGFTLSAISVSLTVQAYNGMAFIRFSIFDYENIVTSINSPYFMDMGFGSNLGGTIPDSSNLALTTTGSIFMGMTDWALSDQYATISYNMSLSGRTYSLSYNNTVTRTQSAYLWYRQEICPNYYFNQSNTCVSCDYSCLTCFAQTNTSCSSCDSASKRTLVSSSHSCPCNTNYLDVGSAICQQIICPTKCSSCSSNNVCSSCLSSSYRTLSNGSCVCQSYTIDMNNLVTCQVCYPTCLTCSMFFSSTACLTCSASRDNRIFNATSKTCNCMNGYYEVPDLSLIFDSYIYIGVPCLTCQYTCATCSDNTSCTSCNSSLHRTTGSNGFCACQSGYYDNNLIQSCFSCPYSCSTCSSSTVCLTCPSTRTLTNNLCPCSVGYYQSGVLACSACNYSCYTCANSSSCSSCNIAYYRSMSNGSCVCASGYYDTYISQTCNSCDKTCSTCTAGASNNCLSCDSTKYRSLSLNNTCTCTSGYFQNGVALLCVACYYTCDTCSDGSLCLTCNAIKNRILSGNSCICSSKYYDDGGNQLCQSCMYFCLTCSSSAACLTCDSSTRNTSNLATCSCLDGYYDNGMSSSCQPCLAACQTCTNSLNCTTCVTNRMITTLGSCSCIARTYEPYCNSCSYSCLSCQGTSSTCISCNGTAMRYLSNGSSLCICYQGYYDDGSNEMCATCQFSCLTCNTSQYCLTCPVNRVLNGSYCSCISTYYQNSSNLNCLPCHYSCTSCSSYSVCTVCNSSDNRVTSVNTSLCACLSGFYDNGNSQVCYACTSICLTCSQFSVCTSCNSTLNFYYSNSTCLCVTGYYFDTTTSSCLSCQYSCNSCASSIACTTCKENRTSTSTLCACVSGLFDNSVTKTCSSCTYPCITCTGASSTCTSCDSTRTLSSASCVCSGSTYDTGLNCSSCLSTCQTCTNGATCTTCLANSSRILNSNNLCVCPTGYHDENGTTLTCQKCQFSCTSCINSLTCSSCYTGRSSVTGGYCACPTNYYYDNGVAPQCVACLYSCLTCSSMSTNCTSCDNSTYRTLINNTCTCQIGYYDDLSSPTCQPCHYSCQKCSGGSSCSICNGTDLRIYVSGPLCNCMSGYYDVSNSQLCPACSYTCQTCISSASTCLTCTSSRNFVNSSSSCACNSGFYDGGASTCNACLYSCATCNNGSSCLTCPSTRLLNSILSCQCITGYYDVTNLATCANCYAACLSCSSYQVCTLCDTQTNFRQLVNSSCLCPTGYYDASSASNYTCQICSYSCATCVSSTQCSSCNSNYQRVFNISSSQCSCITGFYDNLVNAPCVACPYDCLTCFNSTICLTCTSDRQLDSSSRCACINSTYLNGTSCQSCPVECLACQSSSNCSSCNGNRVLSNYACVCASGLYSITGTATCNACQHSCSTCLSSTQCSTCNSTLHRYLTSTYCLCMTGYYDDGVNQTCQSCYYSCSMCANATTCLTCNSAINRVLNTVTLLCDCISGYYEDPTTKACIQCPYSCVTCTNGSACTSCNSAFNRALNSTTNQCNCQSIGYYDTYSSAVCAACSYSCLTCSNSAAYCTSCLNTTNRALSVSSCQCINGYYDVAFQAICLTCSYKCVTCTGSGSNCTLCSSANYRSITPGCTCITGYFDDGANSTCEACNYVCQTCTNILNCATCNLTIAHRIINNITNLCDCSIRYYDNGIQICQSCSYSCQTCSNPTTCLSCPSSRSLTLSQCICLQKYYDDYVNLQCQSCNYTCQSCQNSSSCFSCNSANMRTFNSSTYLCSCLVGYYDTGIQLCSKCDASCYTCTDAISCSSCPPNINKTLNASSGSNMCVCLYSYYQNITGGAVLGYNSVCNPCYFACQTCTGQSTYCTLCSNSSNRYLTTSHQCACLSGYFELSGQQTCISCYTHCLTCTGVNENDCTSCDNTTYYLSGHCYTSCPSFYNISTTSRTCVSCPSNCLSCPTSLSICSQCNSPYFIFSYNSSSSTCVSSCPSYYYQINNTCYQCNSPCLACTAVFTCTSCINLYYLSSGSCNPCHALCLTCSGSTALDCLTCISNYVLKGSVCQKLACLSTQYVQSVSGCVDCLSTFPSSLTCLSTGPTSCQSGYILSNNSCSTCSSVTGYSYDSATGKCKDYCGDHIIITDLCDDGNSLNGDGCSSHCTIETGWICPNNTCSLSSSPNVQLVSLTNNPYTHSITLIISLSVGLRLVDANFILAFTSITQFTFTSTPLNIYYTEYQLTVVYYQSPENNYLTIQIKSPISRLLVTSTTQLSISLSLSISLPIVTNPPAIYVSQASSQVYSQYIYGVLAALHVILLVAACVFLFMRMKIMLLIIDAFNSITIFYILTALGLYNVSLLSYEASRALQPFIYPFGSLLADTTTNFYYFSYTSNFFSSTIIQALVIVTTFLLSVLFSQKDPTANEENIWYYFRAAFMFAFSYDFMLACFSTFFWNTYSSYESSYSWMFAILALIYLISETSIYYARMKDGRGEGKKVVPAISFITNDLEVREKTNPQLNIFEIEDETSKEKKHAKGVLSEWSDEKTEVILGEVQSKQTEETIMYYDLTPSIETEYSSKTRNHISAAHLPVISIFFGLLFTIVANIQKPTARSILFLVISILYLIFIVAFRSESLKSLRNLKLLSFSILYILLSILSLVISLNYNSLNLVKFDTAIVTLVILGILLNIVSFVVSAFRSEAYREYKINKKNEEIMQRTRKQNEARQKIYNKNDSNKEKQNKTKTENTIFAQPESFEVQQQQIQPTEEQVEEKHFKLSDLKKRPNEVRDARTMMQIRDSSSVINVHISDEVSDMNVQHEDLLNQKNIFDLKKSTIEDRSPSKNLRGSRGRVINNSQLSAVSRKGETPSIFFDNSLERIDELKGVKRNVNKSSEKEDIPSKKKVKRKKRPNVETDIVDNEEYYSKQPSNMPKSKLNKYVEEQKRDIEDILEELDMPVGFKKSADSEFRARIMSIDQISSVEGERQQFVEQERATEYEQSVFNKILHDYKKYRHKKIDRKKLKTVKEKNIDLT